MVFVNKARSWPIYYYILNCIFFSLERTARLIKTYKLPSRNSRMSPSIHIYMKTVTKHFFRFLFPGTVVAVVTTTSGNHIKNNQYNFNAAGANHFRL